MSKLYAYRTSDEMAWGIGILKLTFHPFMKQLMLLTGAAREDSHFRYGLIHDATSIHLKRPMWIILCTGNTALASEIGWCVNAKIKVDHFSTIR